MAGGWFAKRFPRRLTDASAADLARMAWNPSYRAPHPVELLDPEPFVPPGPPPMSPRERELLDAVLSDPDADEPRLRYAEWCDQQGDDRGAFIRSQIKPVSPQRARRAQREEQSQDSSGFNSLLLSAPSAPSAVKRVLESLEPWSARDVVFRRGFAEAMSLAGRAFISLSDGLFRTTPLRDLRLVAVAPYMDELARTPNLANLDRLDLTGNWVGPAGVRELAGSPYLTRLRALDLSRNGLGTEGLRELLAAPWRGQLRSLALADNGLTTADVEALLVDSSLNALTELDIAQNTIDPAVIEKMAIRFHSGPLLR